MWVATERDATRLNGANVEAKPHQHRPTHQETLAQ